MPTTYKTNQLQGVLGFSHTDISMNQDNLKITCRNELNIKLSEINISQAELARMFAVSDDPSIITNIQNIFKLQYGTYIDSSKIQIENYLEHEVYVEYKNIDSLSWGAFLADKYKILNSEYQQKCNDGHIYSSPYFLYGIVLCYDSINSKSEITIPMTIDVVFGCIKSEDNNVLPLYQTLYSLNYIKERAGLIEKENEYCHSAAIDKAIKYIEPIANNIFLNTAKVSPKEFLDLFKRILSADPMNELIKDSTFKMPFNLKMVLNIIGLLKAKGYFAKASKPIDDELGEKNKGIFEKKAAQRRVYIDNYATIEDKKAYIRVKELIVDIENIIENYELQRK